MICRIELPLKRMTFEELLDAILKLDSEGYNKLSQDLRQVAKHRVEGET